MSKDRFSISMDEENVEWIDANYNNRSAFLNDLVTDFREGTSSAEDVVAQYRLQQMNAEIASLESQLETLQDQKEAIQDTVTTREERREETLEDAVNALEHTPLEEENPAVQNWAEEVGMDEAELIETVRGRLE